MIVRPKVKGFICTTAHPLGCKQHVLDQIRYVNQQKPFGKVKKKKKKNKSFPKRVLVIGSSMGYGLSSRIVAAFGEEADTIGVCYERPYKAETTTTTETKTPKKTSGRTASAGWYNTATFHAEAQAKGLYAHTINGDAFSHEVKAQTIKAIQDSLHKIELVVYSIAAPKRIDPNTHQTYSSVLKPIDGIFTDKTVHTTTGEIKQMTVTPASNDEIKHTTKVMGGDDWVLWIQALQEANVLASNVVTVAYSYIGPTLTKPIYRTGTIGKAKEHLEQSASLINKMLAPIRGNAYISVNKALVTQASSAIPVLPLYIAILFKVMKQQGSHEDCIQQMYRLFYDKLYPENHHINLDPQTGFIRLDDFEMDVNVQKQVNYLWKKVNNENVYDITDLEGYQREFLRLFGFGYSSINYDDEVKIEVDFNPLSTHS